MDNFSTWEEFSGWLDALGMFHMDLELGRMEKALLAMDLTRPPFAIVQVLGTNGKGSTCAFLDRLAREHGLCSGLYTSPHFVSPRERIRVNGAMLSREKWLDGARAAHAACAHLGLTYFEFLTILALHLFREAGVHLAVLEAGLGGAHDATSAIAPLAQLFTPIAMDHAAIIGPDIASIAKDKACAIRPGARVFSAPQYPECARVLTAQASEKNVPLEFVPPFAPAKDARLAMAGASQLGNAALALAGFRELAKIMGQPTAADREQAAMRNAFMPGRLQFVAQGPGHPPLILDGAHNPHGILALTRFFSSCSELPASLICSFLADKDWKPALGMLCRAFPRAVFFIPGLDNPRAADPAALAAFCAGLLAPGQAKIFTGKGAVADALEQAAKVGGLGLATGSLYLLAEFFALFPQYLEQTSSRGAGPE